MNQQVHSNWRISVISVSFEISVLLHVSNPTSEPLAQGHCTYFSVLFLSAPVYLGAKQNTSVAARLLWPLFFWLMRSAVESRGACLFALLNLVDRPADTPDGVTGVGDTSESGIYRLWAQMNGKEGRCNYRGCFCHGDLLFVMITMPLHWLEHWYICSNDTRGWFYDRQKRRHNVLRMWPTKKELFMMAHCDCAREGASVFVSVCLCS